MIFAFAFWHVSILTYDIVDEGHVLGQRSFRAEIL
jgi:hypothetical protein